MPPLSLLVLLNDPAVAGRCPRVEPVLMDGLELRVPDRGSLPAGECDLLVNTSAAGVVEKVSLLRCPEALVSAASGMLRALSWRPARACREDAPAETAVALIFGEPGPVRNVTELVRVREQVVPNLPAGATALPEGQFLSCDLRIYPDRKGIAHAASLMGCARVRPRSDGGDGLEQLPEPIEAAMVEQLRPILSAAGSRWRFYPGLSDMTALPSPFDLTLVFTP